MKCNYISINGIINLMFLITFQSIQFTKLANYCITFTSNKDLYIKYNTYKNITKFT